MKKRHSIYRQLLLLFFCTLLPVALFGSAFLLGSLNLLQENAETRVEQNLTKGINVLNERLGLCFNRGYSMLYENSSSAKEVLYNYHDPLMFYSSIRKLSDRATNFFSDELLDEIYIYYPDHSFAVSVGESDYQGSLMPTYHKHIDESDWRSALGDTGSYLSYDGQRLQISIGYPLVSTGSNTSPHMLLCTKLNTAAISELLSRYAFSGKCLLMVKGKMIGSQFTNYSDNINELPSGKSMIIIEGNTYYAWRVDTDYQDIEVVNLVNKTDIQADNQRISVLLAVYLLLSIIVFCVYAGMVRRRVSSPITSLLQYFEKIESGQFGIQIPASKALCQEFDCLSSGFNHMSNHLQEASDIITEQRTFTQRMELKQLQMQINPHFLYNTFYMIQHMIENEDMEGARQACGYIGGFYKYITRSGNEYVPFCLEYKHMKDYLALQKMRYLERLHLEVDEIPESTAGLIVPRLVLEPLVENVFVHTRPIPGKGYSIRVRCKLNTDQFIVLIENSSDCTPTEALSLDLDSINTGDDITGLKNIHRRIRLCFGSPYGLSLAQSTLGGLAVTMILPVEGAHSSYGASSYDSNDMPDIHSMPL